MSSRHGECSEIQRGKLQSVVQIANGLEVDVVACCGDIFHSPRAGFGEALVWLDFCNHLHKSIHVYAIPGNHDGGQTAYGTGAFSFIHRLGVVDTTNTESLAGLPYTVLTPNEYPKSDILLLHMQLGPFGTSLDDLASRVRSRLVIVGHNHSGYPTYVGENALGEPCKIVVPGSLFRVSALEDEIRREIEVVVIDTETLDEQRYHLPGIVSPETAFDLDHVAEQRQREKHRESLLELPEVVVDRLPTCSEIVKYAADSLGHGDGIRERVQELVG